MSREELIEEIRLGIKSKRLLEAASIGAVEIDGKLIAIKSRYREKETEELLKDKDSFVTVDEVISSRCNPAGFTFLIYDHSLFNLRGVKALDELEKTHHSL